MLELKDRLGAPSPAGGAGAVPLPSDHREQVVEALVGLGWPARAAQDAVAAVLMVLFLAVIIASRFI